MRPVNAAAHALRESRAKLIERLLLWIEPRNRGTGTPDGFGFWTGRDVVTVGIVDAWTGATVARNFDGRGSIVDIPSIRYASGLDIHPVDISLSLHHDGVRAAVRTLEARAARAQLHRLTLHPETREVVGVERAFKGNINLANDSDGVVVLQMVSTVRSLTIKANRTKSDAFQRLRNDDRFRRYKAIAGEIDIPWGGKGVHR